MAVVAMFGVSLTTAENVQRRTSSIGSERAVGGLTVEEQGARQQQLHRELSARLPKGLGAAPLEVPITEQDRDGLATRFPSGTAPLRVGVVKSLPEFVGKPFGRAFNHGVVKKNRNGSGDFWTRSVAASTGTILLSYTGTTPEIDKRKMSFVISELGHIRGRRPNATEKSHDSWPCSDNAPCVVDVNYVNTGPAAPAETAVAKMEWISGRFINTCSGGLLADTDSSSQIPYFLTAIHCFTTDISNLETFFNYTTDSCNGACPDGAVTGGTPPPASTVGGTVVATGSAADYTLLTLDQAPPAGSTFLGWNNTPIHNSAGANLYRVSNANFGPQVYSQHDVDPTSSTCTGWDRGPRIYSVDQIGATMGGSSGSPVLNSAGEVVGQLSGCCGFNCADECDSASNWTVDGAFANYWGNVAQFLDPPAGCTTDAECDDGQFCTGVETCNAGTCQSSGDPCTGGTTCNEATDSCDAPACDNDGACDAGEDCNNCPNDCRQKVNGNPRTRYCCDGNLQDCGNSECSTNGWSCGGAGGGCTLDSECDDGQFCNGAEVCSGGSCQSGADPCVGQGCDEATDQCVTCGASKDTCSTNSDCCSNNCKRGSCKGN